MLSDGLSPALAPAIMQQRINGTRTNLPEARGINEITRHDSTSAVQHYTLHRARLERRYPAAILAITAMDGGK